jgi:ribosome-associated heat shock protein Hsp15
MDCGVWAVYFWSMESVRLDKWLWAARFFKTRSQAARACDLGRVKLNGQAAKPARELHVGMMLALSAPAGDFQVEVLGLSDLRGSAAVAQTLYRETDESKAARLQAAAERKAMAEWERLPAGKPSKRDRRAIIRIRGRG